MELQIAVVGQQEAGEGCPNYERFSPLPLGGARGGLTLIGYGALRSCQVLESEVTGIGGHVCDTTRGMEL